MLKFARDRTAIIKQEVDYHIEKPKSIFTKKIKDFSSTARDNEKKSVSNRSKSVLPSDKYEIFTHKKMNSLDEVKVIEGAI